jgi:hypothetical protein
MVTAVKAVQKAKSPKPKKASQKGPKKAGVKGSKKKKQALKFVIECKNPVEDGIMKAEAFVSDHD